MKKHGTSKKRQVEHRKKIGEHFKETEYSTPKEARKGSMLQKRSMEEGERDKRRLKKFSEKHK